MSWPRNGSGRMLLPLNIFIKNYSTKSKLLAILFNWIITEITEDQMMNAHGFQIYFINSTCQPNYLNGSIFLTIHFKKSCCTEELLTYFLISFKSTEASVQ